MKKIFLHSVVVAMLLLSCQGNSKQEETSAEVAKNFIKVGVFDRNGDNPYCIIDAMEALKIDAQIVPVLVSAADILSGKADEIDVFLLPGGSGRSETGSLGELGQEKIIELVKKQGKGVVGICAGAYALSETPDYPSLALSGAEAIDIEHDHRGHGLVKFSLTGEGKKIFPELVNQEISFCQYYEGPVLIPAKNTAYPYIELATMLSDVHLIEGTPANMTNNRPFVIITNVEKGRTASVVGHPENTQGMRWMIPRLVRVVARKELITYKKNVVRPEIYTQEILFTPEILKKQRRAYENLIKSKAEKMQAMKDIVAIAAWSAKKWIPPMLRDKDFEVRLLAAQLTVELERTEAIPDLETSVMNEKNIENKKLLKEQLEALKNMLGK